MKQVLIPVLASCLVVAALWAQELPEGEGKTLVQNVCGSCHGLDIVVEQRVTKEQWQGIVESMVQRGATVTDEEITAIVAYLAKNYAPPPK
ncbi:MAG: cytochrome c [Acidobacteriota bacterium]